MIQKELSYEDRRISLTKANRLRIIFPKLGLIIHSTIQATNLGIVLYIAPSSLLKSILIPESYYPGQATLTPHECGLSN